MPSDKHNSVTDKDTGILFSLLDITSAQQVPFGILQYIQCMHHGLKIFLNFVLIFFSLTVQGIVAVVHDGFSIHL